MKDENYVGAILEEVCSQNNAVLEAVADIRTKVDQLPTRDEFVELKQDMKAMKVTLTGTNRQVQDHGQRITRLEVKA